MLLHNAAKAQKRTKARAFSYEGGKAAGLWYENFVGAGGRCFKASSISTSPLSKKCHEGKKK